MRRYLPFLSWSLLALTVACAAAPFVAPPAPQSPPAPSADPPESEYVKGVRGDCRPPPDEALAEEGVACLWARGEPKGHACCGVKTVGKAGHRIWSCVRTFCQPACDEEWELMNLECNLEGVDVEETAL